MKLGRVLVAGIVIAVFNAVVGMILCGGVFNWVYKLEPINVWKPMEGPPGVEYFVGLLILSIIFVFVYALLNKGIPGNRLGKGFIFGLCVWAVGVLPGMFATYIFMAVANTVVIYWTISALILTPIKGMIASIICG